MSGLSFGGAFLGTFIRGEEYYHANIPIVPEFYFKVVGILTRDSGGSG